MGCRVVLIKCGTSGMYCCTGSEAMLAHVGSRLELDTALWANHEGIQPCFKADQVLSGTGAGDTSIAAFLLAAAKGRTPAQCAALAAAEGACAVTAYDALGGLKTMEELEARIASGWETMGG
jgi:sugar/nucleoside kinase (ribokinase family)